MSVISDRHQFVPLTKDSKPMDGQRLIRLIAKGPNYPTNLTQSMCVSVPRVSAEAVVDCIDRLLPHVVGMVQDAQDKIARELRIESGASEVSDEQLSVNAVIAWLDANAAGDRVSSEYLSEWFKEEYEEVAREWIASTLDAAKDSAAVSAKCAVLREMFAGWSSHKYSPPIPKLKAMIRFGEVCSDVDGRMSGILTRCQVMLAKKEAELQSDALGF